jgi:hydrogenase 3 maturation protease
MFMKKSEENHSFQRDKMIEQALQKWFSSAKKVVLAGIGNPLRKDDFVGVKVVEDLKDRVSRNVFLIECETVPESFIQQIIDFNPTHILLLDAAILGLKPGSLKLVNPKQLEMIPAFSTHMLPLRMFCEYLAKMTKAKIALLAIQPKNADFGEGLTLEIQKAAEYITSLLLKLLP